MNETNHLDTNQTPLNASTNIKFIDIVFITLCSFGIILFGSFVLLSWANISIFDHDVLEDPPLYINVSMAALEGIALLLSIYIFGIRLRHLNWRDLGLRPTNYKWILVAITLVIIFIPIIAVVAIIIQYLLGLPYENPQLDFLLPEQFSWVGAFGMLVLGGFIVPFAEELFFRGILYQWLKDKAGVWIGIIGSSLVFGLLHGDLPIAGATFVMGIILAWLFERSNSLWPSITIHIVNNSLKIVLLYLMTSLGLSVQ